MTDADLVRFVDAQALIRDHVTEELTRGDKRSHWMWFVFPQIAGLGHSAMAKRYAIQDLGQARRYLSDPVLGEGLRQDVKLLLSHEDRSALQMLGSPDDLKLRSCLTLFQTAATDHADRDLFAKALDRFYDGKPDARTLAILGD